MDTEEVLARLAGLIPPPPSVDPIDWEGVEERFGTALPADFKAFCDRWGPGNIEGSGPLRILADGGDVRWILEWLADSMEDGFTERAPLFPEAGGLLPWGNTESRWWLTWRTAGEPGEWSVAVIPARYAADGDPVLDTGRPFTRWLMGALDGTLEEELVPPELWLEPDAPRVGARGHRWYSWTDEDDEDDEDDLEGDPRPTNAVSAFGTDDEGLHVTLDLGGVLDRDRREALDDFLAYLAAQDAALRAAVTEARARNSREIVALRTSDAIPGVARAAVAFVAAELEVEYDASYLDSMLEFHDDLDSP
jgi:hypothetical protein